MALRMHPEAKPGSPAPYLTGIIEAPRFRQRLALLKAAVSASFWVQFEAVCTPLLTELKGKLSKDRVTDGANIVKQLENGANSRGKPLTSRSGC